MKNLTTILGIAVFSLSLFACSQKEDNAPIEAPQANIITASRELNIEGIAEYENGVPDENTVGCSYALDRRPGVSITYDLDREKIVSWMIEDDVYKIIYDRKGLNRMQVNQAIDKKLLQPNAVVYNGSLAACINLCNDKYTDPNGKKKPGRGECKFYCILDWAADVLTRVFGIYKDKEF